MSVHEARARERVLADYQEQIGAVFDGFQSLPHALQQALLTRLDPIASRAHAESQADEFKNRMQVVQALLPLMTRGDADDS